MQQCDLEKQVTKYRRLSCILGVCCIALLTANAVLIAQGWPCLASTWEARWPSPITSSASTPPLTVFDESGRFRSIEDGTHGITRRTSADTSSSNRDTSVSSGSSGGHEGHPHDAMLFLFSGIIIGVFILHLTMHPKLHSIQHTSTLFVLGMGYALLMEGLELRNETGVLGKSYTMWMQIDPHLILFTLLPALLAGDAMAIDTSIVKRVANQCIFLAGPGVLIGSLLTAGFVMLYSGWEFKLALTMGSILAATDPVAVVSLLKQLGASPTLTVQIAGESLLNDGTAIVLYTIAFEMLQGETYDPAEILIFILRKAIAACGLGWVIGWVFVIWINAASNRFEHHSSTIQICLTLCCAYWSFIMAEGVLEMSGVLCTVAASMVLADKMWMSIVEKEAMQEVWHIFEFIGNTLIFFLAGALTGNCMVHMPLLDYLHLLVFYLVSMLIRGLIIFGSRPILQRLSQENVEVSKAEALIMTVGGLRGAVGLALAIQVSAQKDEDFVDEMDAQRVLFYTGGIAMLTLVVNASICPTLVKACGLVQADDTKKKMLLILHQQMFSMATKMINSDGVRHVLEELLCDVRTAIDAKYDKRKVVDDHDLILDYDDAATRSSMGEDCTDGDLFQSVGKSQKVGAEFSHSAVTAKRSFLRDDSPGAFSTSLAFFAPKRTKDTGGSRSSQKPTLRAFQMYFNTGVTPLADGCDVVHDFVEIKKLYELSVEKHKKKVAFLDLPVISELRDETHLTCTVENCAADQDMMEATIVTFLALVKAQYWHQIDNGEFIEGSSHPDALMGSIAIGVAMKKLTDLDFLVQELGMTDFDFGKLRRKSRTSMQAGASNSQHSWISNKSEGRAPRFKKAKTNLQDVLAVSNVVTNNGANTLLDKDARRHCAKKIISSTAFNAIITCVIIANVLNVFIEEGFKNDQQDDYSIWLTIEIVFNILFIIEFVFKVVGLGCDYFKSGWNCFELSLIFFGLFGIIVEISWQMSDEKDKDNTLEDGNLSQEARLFRLNRVFRVMRLVRVFRLVKFIQILQAKLAGNEISLELATHLRKITLLTAFIRATQASQVHLLEYFGGPAKPRVELARCLVESQINILKASTMAIVELSRVDSTILESLSILRESGRVADSLSDFIHKAQKVNVVSAREADNLLAPLHHRRRIWLVLLRESEMGVLRNDFQKFSQMSKSVRKQSQDDRVNDEDWGFKATDKSLPSGMSAMESQDWTFKATEQSLPSVTPGMRPLPSGMSGLHAVQSIKPLPTDEYKGDSSMMSHNITVGAAGTVNDRDDFLHPCSPLRISADADMANLREATDLS